MSSKQDRQGVRTAAQLEQKYQFDKRFAEIYGIATDARTKAEEAQGTVGKLDKNLTHDEIFNRLTDNGKYQAIYRENGNIYINASFLKAGHISSDMIKAGVIRSADYEVVEVDFNYPSSELYPSETLYPNNGEDIYHGLEIDFAAGVIRGVLTSPLLEELTNRVAALEAAVFPNTLSLEGEQIE